jgi:hypothetical protein
MTPPLQEYAMPDNTVVQGNHESERKSQCLTHLALYEPDVKAVIIEYNQYLELDNCDKWLTRATFSLGREIGRNRDTERFFDRYSRSALEELRKREIELDACNKKIKTERRLYKLKESIFSCFMYCVKYDKNAANFLLVLVSGQLVLGFTLGAIALHSATVNKKLLDVAKFSLALALVMSFLLVGIAYKIKRAAAKDYDALCQEVFSGSESNDVEMAVFPLVPRASLRYQNAPPRIHQFFMDQQAALETSLSGTQLSHIHR